MQIRKWVYFETKNEKTEFIRIIQSSRTDIEAIQKISDKYPEISLFDIEDAVKNFIKELGKEANK